LRQQSARMRQASLDVARVCGERFQVIDGDGLTKGEWAGLRAAERCEVRAAADELAQFMRDGADVTARGDRDLKTRLHFSGRRTFEREQCKAVNDDARGFDLDGLAGPG